MRLGSRALRLARELAARPRQAATLSASDWVLLLRAILVVAYTRICVWLLPWRRLTASLGAAEQRPSHPVSPQRLAWAVKVASRAVPCATCLTQALALYQLLARYGYSSIVQVGVRNADGQFTAHAWVEHEGLLLLGAPADVAGYSRFFTLPEFPLGQP